MLEFKQVESLGGNVDPTTRRFITEEIDRALRCHGLPSDSPIRYELERNAEIGGGRTPVVRVHTDSNRIMTFGHRIEELRHDPQFSRYFPPEPARISRHDQDKIRENFSRIADGEVVVE